MNINIEEVLGKYYVHYLDQEHAGNLIETVNHLIQEIYLEGMFEEDDPDYQQYKKESELARKALELYVQLLDEPDFLRQETTRFDMRQGSRTDYVFAEFQRRRGTVPEGLLSPEDFVSG